MKFDPRKDEPSSDPGDRPDRRSLFGRTYLMRTLRGEVSVEEQRARFYRKARPVSADVVAIETATGLSRPDSTQ
jgi:hypothetical protein